MPGSWSGQIVFRPTTGLHRALQRQSCGPSSTSSRGSDGVLPVEEIASRGDRIIDEVERAVVGKREALELVLMGFLADGHVLVEDFPGLAKTLIARSFAQVADMRFSRIQFTPDLMPSDVTGSAIFNQRTSEFEFRPAPVFANLVLGD